MADLIFSSEFSIFAIKMIVLDNEDDPEDDGVKALFFLFLALFVCVMVTYLQLWSWNFNFLKFIPYTVIIFTIGLIIGFSTDTSESNIFIDSVKLYDNFNPELVLYLFIPALIFGEVSSLNMHHLKNTMVQGILLAAPGALLGALMLAGLMISGYFIPFQLNWNKDTVLVFSSILCATDPVSVVSLLSQMELFRSQKLKYIITNEALLNDAMALVLYTIFMAGVLVDESAMTSYDILIYSLKVIFISPLVGFAFGLVSLALVFPVSRDKSREEYSVIKIIIPICAAYLSFFVGNYILEDSGILCVYCTGVIYSWLVPSFFRHNEAVHSVWSSIEWTANTLVFLLAGVVIGFRSRPFFTVTDMVNVFVIYLLLAVIRAVVTMLFFPVLKCSLREALFVAFSGLRGAIAISLALSFNMLCQKGRTTISVEEGNRFFFYVGGVAAWTLIINATFAEHVLAFLKLSEKSSTPSQSVEIMRDYTRKRLIKSVLPEWLGIPQAHRSMLIQKCKLLKLIDDSKAAMKHDLEMSPTTKTNLSNLTETELAGIERAKKHRAVLTSSMAFRASRASQAAEDKVDEELMVIVRSAFLECVRSFYWTRVQKGILARSSYVTRTLIASVDLGLETVNTVGLDDWNYLKEQVLGSDSSSGWSWSSAVNEIYSFLRRHIHWIEQFEIQREEHNSLILSTFIAAHEHAQIKIPFYFGEVGEIDTLEQAQVVQESQAHVQLAMEKLSELLHEESSAAYLMTKEKVLSIFSRWESMLYEFREDAAIMNSDLMYFLEAIEEDRTLVEDIYSSIHNHGYFSAAAAGKITKARRVSVSKTYGSDEDILKPLLG